MNMNVVMMEQAHNETSAKKQKDIWENSRNSGNEIIIRDCNHYVKRRWNGMLAGMAIICHNDLNAGYDSSVWDLYRTSGA